MTALVVFLALIASLAVWTRALSRAAETAQPPTGAFQPVTGGTIHYVEAGPKEAQPIVLIHGLAGNLHHFTYAMVDILAKSHHVIALDRPGSGYSTRVDDGQATLEAQATMIWEFLDRQGITNPVLVGHSLGGAVALAMTLERPDAPAALALLCPATQPQAGIPDVFRPLHLKWRGMRRVLAHTLVVPMTRLTRRRMLQEIFAPDPVPTDFETRGGGPLALRPETFISASADLMATRESVSHLTERYATDLRVPGAILFAEDDAILSPDHHGTPMAAFGFDTTLLPGHGHMIPLTAPEACAEFILQTAAKARA
ncbi:alpha/beta fold hydrolase [Shimia aestuarii]|uniref:Pimeloyl-ACP methyl ester carboxylesterase n=1 Tax=Shimia aestuarii TaxID=254406 RepID=A0A1I4S0Y6_9RHOB|nr:alpha/beta fold hydrolase [Shimia aestuarii]SFM58178.1 Pimeloyl-ACP methyl ester carboxylesterase [Shimia aestuarii]